MSDILDRTRIPIPFEVYLNAFPPRPAMAGNPLPFVNTTQTQCLWCWAAVTSNINNFLARQPPITQCAVAGDALGKNCCGPAAPGCNTTYQLDLALGKYGCYAPPLANPTFNDIEVQIGNGRPLGARIDLTGNDGNVGAHFVALYGYVPAGPAGPAQVHVADPLYDSHLVTFDVLRNSYASLGRWTTTYHTT